MSVQAPPRISLKNILFATDFSASSELALPFVKAMARHYGSTIFVAHVYHPEPMYEMPLDPVAPEFARHLQEAEKRMNTFLQVHDFKDLRHKTLLQPGDVWPGLSLLIEKNEIDLIVMGTHGRQGIKDLVLGSVAEEVVRSASCPVMTVGPNVSFEKGATAGEFRRILYATNFSPASEQALAAALALAQETRAQLTLLHVVEEPAIDSALPYPQAELDRTKQQLRDMLPTDAKLWCEPEVIVEVGTPADVILQYAKNAAADLIVMGAHRSLTPHASAHAPWRTAHQVICQAHCPVLTLRA